MVWDQVTSLQYIPACTLRSSKAVVLFRAAIFNFRLDAKVHHPFIDNYDGIIKALCEPLLLRGSYPPRALLTKEPLPNFCGTLTGHSQYIHTYVCV